jgi:hypothetical protein
MGKLRGLGLFAGLAIALVCSPGNSAEWQSLTLDCKLKASSVLGAENGQVKSKAPKPDDVILLTFTGFDEKAGSAVSVANQGSGPVLFFDVMGHIQLIEITEGKNVATTTITINEQEIRAVQIRHMWLFDSGVFSVYAGPCSAR